MEALTSEDGKTTNVKTLMDNSSGKKATDNHLPSLAVLFLINVLAKESTPGPLSHLTNTLENGKTDNAMERANRSTRMDLGTKDLTKTINAMEIPAPTAMLTAASMSAPGSTMKNQVITATSLGPIKTSTRASSITESVLLETLRTPPSFRSIITIRDSSTTPSTSFEI